VHAAPDSEARVAALNEALELMESNASWLLSSPDILRRCRLMAEAEEGAHLSLERRKIWEPVTLLYYDCKKRVGIYRNGPVQKILRILHEGLGLKPPKAESVLRAIKDFRHFVEEHGRPAASPADSIYSAAIAAGRISCHPGTLVRNGLQRECK